MSNNGNVQLPRISSYGQYSSDNYGAHCLRVELPQVTVWFSYQTMVAFQFNGHSRKVLMNHWGPTTGKHLNAIDGGNKKERLSREAFEKAWTDDSANPEQH